MIGSWENVQKEVTRICDAITQGGGSSTRIDSVENIISDKWNTSTSYSAGDYAIYNDILWKALTDNTGVAPSEGSTWTIVSITSEIDIINDTLENTKVNSINFSGTTHQYGGIYLPSIVGIPVNRFVSVRCNTEDYFCVILANGWCNFYGWNLSSIANTAISGTLYYI